MNTYTQALREAMSLCASYPNAIILGQSVQDGGTAMRATLDHLPDDKLHEMPVCEDLQLGLSIGLSLQGHFPVVSVYPRVNFLMLAMSQLVLHLDAIPRYSDYRPKVIIRTAIATSIPLDPGPQHLGDFYEELSLMLKKVKVEVLTRTDEVLPAYKSALQSEHSTVIIEYSELYNI